MMLPVLGCVLSLIVPITDYPDAVKPTLKAAAQTAATAAIDFQVYHNITGYDVAAGQRILVDLSSSGGTEPYVYTVAYRTVSDDGQTLGSWRYVQYQQANEFVNFSIDTSGRYILYAAVVDSNNTIARYTYDFYVHSVSDPETDNDFTYLLFAVSVLIGIEFGKAFSFWKW